MHESVRLDVMDSLAGRKLKYLNASHQIGGWAGYKFVFYKFTIELNYSRDQNKYSDYDSDDKYSVYVSDGPAAYGICAFSRFRNSPIETSFSSQYASS